MGGVMAEAIGSKGTIRSVQISRAIAAFMVAYLHSTGRGAVILLPSTGNFGVDIFFIISGFVIAFMGSKGNAFFFLKRLFRIVPLYVIATLLMVLACVVFPEKINHAVANIPAFIKSILFIPYNIETKFEPSGPILGVGWTLNYEIFFYLIMAISIKTAKTKKHADIICACVLGILYIILNIIDSDVFILQYYQNSLFPEFICGILLYEIYKRLKGKEGKNLIIENSILNVIVFGTLCIASFIYMVGDSIYTWHTINNRNIHWGIPSLIMVFSFLNIEEQIKNNKFTRFCILLGDSSYALYLFHSFIIMFLTRIIFSRIIMKHQNIIVSIALEIIIMALTVIGSIIIYYTIDKPIQNGLRKLLKRRSKNV
jgi:peptidoglycan/LPS O-acetylase OafA/YrhL